MIVIDLQGTAAAAMVGRQRQVIDFSFRIEDGGVPVDLGDVTAISFVVRETNAIGRVLLNLSLGNGITIDGSDVILSAETPTYEGFGGGAKYSLTLTTDAGARSILEGPFTVIEYKPVA